jgi:hypothetical protein
MSMQQVYNSALFDSAGIANDREKDREKDREQEAQQGPCQQEEGDTGTVCQAKKDSRKQT